ncbi:MAG: DNA-directed RNA polymerase subunit beta', partial [Acidimicrobiia bacterium]|nr:DNA-directed RNA polymerase subunit beta' [Acidimicrobiia bacterium]
VVDALLMGEDLSEDDQPLVGGVDFKNLDKARDLGNGLLRDVVDTWEDGQDIRELTNDLCLRTDGRIQKEDLDAIIQWALKVREMYLDIESRREDTREAAVDSVRRLEQTWQLFRDLEPKMVVNDEQLFRELKDRFGSPYGFGVYFRGGMGAESIRDLLRDLDLDLEAATLRDTIKTSKGQKQQRAIKRLKVVNAFIKSENRPEWMILEAIPVIPPELRPMVQLDGGRFATSDLNDLYRRVINRNNRLKRLLDLGAPEIIVNNEKRMLQEAVDALFDNGRRGRAVTGPGNRPLKSLSDMLKGKQGRFRQNLLGKRVDYSGRSVIVVGPTLKLHQCGLPKLMALELFKPFVMKKLVDAELAQNIKSAKRMVERRRPQVWDVLEEAIKEHPVLLNRAPTLHRLGIQAFEPVLVEGKAIQIHPLVCTAFNADFDGDQMAVHLPLSAEAQAESRVLMLSANNVLSPAHGRPLVTPTQDMVIGAFYLTEQVDGAKGEGRIFRHLHEVERAYEAGDISLHATITLRGSLNGDSADIIEREPDLETTAGRLFFNGALPDEVEYVNERVDKRVMGRIVDQLANESAKGTVATSLDQIKNLCFRFAAKSGLTISIDDVKTPATKAGILADHEVRADKVEDQFRKGIITDGERRQKEVEIWTSATDLVREDMEKELKAQQFNPIDMMVGSGARGNMMQVRQIA